MLCIHCDNEIGEFELIELEGMCQECYNSYLDCCGDFNEEAKESDSY